ncbi:MAG TPA: PQQ-binding-like beta-propeller repeat protein [Gemmataceae bacterium]|jgi:outer membrane protein assembly factor BamB|nr:PQQ-binding-like beta-propeller repeat protein [Gemmataceae bacterium]
MVTVPGSSPTIRHATWRFWFPFVGAVLAALALAAIWAWPDREGYILADRVFSTLIIVTLTLLVLFVWGLAFSRYRWFILVAGILIIGAVLGSVRHVRFTGDMIPIVQFRWDKTADDLLEEHRANPEYQKNVPPIDLASNDAVSYGEYRGRNRDGVVEGPALARDWQAQAPRLLWRQPVGGGYASFAIAGNAALTIEQRRDQEAVVCYDTATGKERWKHEYAAHFSEALGGPGPRATPTIAGTEVFSLGAQGMLVCMELATGKVKWSVNILQDNDNVSWAMSGSPLVLDKLVIVNPGAQKGSASGKALMALDRVTGKPTWTSGTTRAGYSSPMVATLAGHRQILLFDGDQVGGFDTEKGRELWHFKWETMNGINVAQPLVLPDNRVFISTAYGVGCALLKVTEKEGQWSVAPIWQNKNMRCKMSSPIYYGGHIYGLDEGILACLDAASGARQWREGRYGHGQLLLTGDLLLILSETGKLALVEANPERFRELGKIEALDGKTWNVPALVEGKVFIRNTNEMACYDLPLQETP